MDKKKIVEIIAVVAVIILGLVLMLNKTSNFHTPNLVYEITNLTPPRGVPLHKNGVVGCKPMFYIDGHTLITYDGSPVENPEYSTTQLPGDVIFEDLMTYDSIPVLICQTESGNHLIISTHLGNIDFDTDMTRVLYFSGYTSTDSENRGVIGVDERTQTLFRYDLDGNIIKSNRLDTEYAFQDYVSTSRINATSCDFLVSFNLDTLDVIYEYHLPASVPLSKIIVPRSEDEKFIVGERCFFFFSNGRLEEMIHHDFYPELIYGGYRILGDNKLIYYDSECHIRMQFELLSKIFYTNFRHDIDVFARIDENSGGSELAIVGVIKNQLYNVEIDYVDDVIKEVIPSCADPSCLYLIGEKAVYKTLHPAYWEEMDSLN